MTRPMVTATADNPATMAAIPADVQRGSSGHNKQSVVIPDHTMCITFL